jgi:hypothetical protein
MFTLVNLIENKVIAEPKNVVELIDKLDKIRIENEDFDFSILGLSDAIEYVEDYCDNLDLLEDSKVNEFLSNHSIEVEDNEPDHYVELMMDNHKCAEFKGKEYYISDSLTLTDDEEKIYDVLVYTLHV